MIKITRTDIAFLAQKYFDRVCEDASRKIGLKRRVELARNKERNKRKKKFYTDLYNDICLPFSDSIITAPPSKLAAFIKKYEAAYPGLFTRPFISHLNSKVFFYENYSKWGDKTLANDLKVNVCPYCNRHYTFTINQKANGTRPQFDHFFSKASYPYLSMSFFNLIPSCSICNSTFKGTEKFTLKSHVHPYLEGFSHYAKFKLSAKNIDFINGNSSAYEINLVIDPSVSKPFKRRLKGNIKTFAIDILYKMHQDYADEIIQKAIVYNKAYFDSLYNSFKGTLFSDVNDVKRMVLSNYTQPEDHEKRVLGKFTSDIAEDIGLI